MTLRDAIRAALSGGDASALADVPGDDVGQALTSYADTSSLNEADALAPLVTRVSPVSFDEELDGALGTPIDDVHAEFDSLDPPASELGASSEEDVDPSESVDDDPTGPVGNDAGERDPDAFDRDRGDSFDVNDNGTAPGPGVMPDEAASVDDLDDFGAGQARDAAAPADVPAPVDTFEAGSAPGFDATDVDAINDLALDTDSELAASSDIAVGADDLDEASSDDTDFDFDA